MVPIKTIPFIPKRKKRATAPPAPPALSLTAASFVVATSVTLSFDRAIDISAINPSAIVVNDGVNLHREYQGAAPITLIDPQTVRISLMDTGRSFDHAVLLRASADNGIVAVNDGSAWSGAEGLELPWP